MKMKQIAIAISALLMAGSAAAELSANIGATSNYVWRGATQTDDNAAVQGGIDYAHDSGFYLGTWVSNVDFGSGGEVEWDLYGGFGGEVGGFGYDLGIIYYAYPDSTDANFTELALGGSWEWLSAGINYTIASDVNDTSGGAEAFIDGDLAAPSATTTSKTTASAAPISRTRIISWTSARAPAISVTSRSRSPTPTRKPMAAMTTSRSSSPGARPSTDQSLGHPGRHPVFGVPATQ